MKHYAPNICLPLKTALLHKTTKSEKGDNSVKYLQIFPKTYSGHLHLGHNPYAKYHDPSSNGSPDILFTMSFMGQMPKSEKGNNSVKF